MNNFSFYSNACSSIILISQILHACAIIASPALLHVILYCMFCETVLWTSKRRNDAKMWKHDKYASVNISRVCGFAITTLGLALKQYRVLTVVDGEIIECDVLK